MHSIPFLNSGLYQTEGLPSLTERKSVRESKAYAKSVMDSLERIGIQQLGENLKYSNFYRMADGKLSFQELSEVVPHLEGLEHLLDGVGVPTFLRHYDIIGILVNALVGKYIEFQDKFNIVDVSEIASSEFQRFKNEEVSKMLGELIENEISIHMAEQGFDPNGREFQSQEEQQQFMEQVKQFRDKYTPKDTLRDANKSFKTLGVQWGNATMDKDKELMNIDILNKDNLKDYLLTGRCFREFRVHHNSYYSKNWSPKNTFIPKEYETKRSQDGEYIGRIQLYTPGEFEKEYSQHLTADIQKKLVGKGGWKRNQDSNVFGAPGNLGDSFKSNFNQPVRVPFENFNDYQFVTSMEDLTGIPMSHFESTGPNGDIISGDRFTPRYYNNPSTTGYRVLSKVLRDDFEPRNDLVVVTEAYLRCYELWGYLTYENSVGRIVTEEVTEDILDDFIKENNIKQKFNQVILGNEESVDSFEVNTIIWKWKPVVYEGVKAVLPFDSEPIYPYFRPCEFQLTGDNPFDVKLPVAGLIDKGIAEKVEPYQATVNLCLNQVRNMMEKEIGLFFLMDVGLIPSEYKDYGSTEDALIHIRNLAKDIGIVPGTVDPENQKGLGNNIQTYDINYSRQIATRLELASRYQAMGYAAIGINPVQQSQTPNYSTAEGIKLSNEISYAQVAEIYQMFSFYEKGMWEMHLGVAQYAQSNKKDQSFDYTKSDGSRVFLKNIDPSFPLRKLGVVPSMDPKKKKELMEFKQIAMQRNTMDSDLLELAQLYTSDSMQMLIESAAADYERKQAAKRMEYEQQIQVVEANKQKEIEVMQMKHQLEEESKVADRQNKLDVSRITALGRASDKDSDAMAFQEINKSADRALRETSFNAKMEAEAERIRVQEKDVDNRMDLRTKELELKAKALEQRERDRVTKETGNIINKN